MDSIDKTALSGLNMLVVEDHDALRAVTVEMLATHGGRVLGLDSAEAMDELPADFRADVAVLDLNLPGEDGLSLARRLRALQPGIGIVMLTARHLLEQKLAGYAHGADLYLTKPTEPAELCAAIVSLVRRLQPSAPQASFVFHVGLARVDTPRGSLRLREAEAKVLHALARAPSQRLEHWQLLELLGKMQDEAGKAQLEVLISRLRSKLVSYGAPEQPIRPERGWGYRLCMALQLG